MKREVIFIFMFLFLLISISLVYASEEEQVAKAYACLEGKINQSGCSTFSFEEKVFSFLATGKCQNELMLENLSDQCWPKPTCKIKSTAQAVLALNKEVNTTKAENWLLTQTAIPTDMDWFLETESLNSTSCTITYSGASHTILIAEDKKISASNLGNCLTLAQDNYWLKISPSCYNIDIDISCDKSFITTLLFKKKESSTVHVSETVHSSAAKGITTEKVDSFCFSQGGVCNYEGSLWASFVLYSLKYDISKFMPYLITMMDDESNKVYIPESFLYFITGKFEVELLSKQNGLYWEESGNRYYDTALALLPLYYESPLEKENSKAWLLDVQQNTGCWNSGNLRDTAFILYSIWPTQSECSVNSDCLDISCKESSCNDNVCFYDYFNCIDNDGCCSPDCNILTDNDCENEPKCVSDSDCDIYSSETNEYCSADKTKVYKNVSTWGCQDSICVEDKQPELVETCSVDEQCYAGSCVNDIPIECDTNYDCAVGESCINGVCTLLGCEENNGYCMSPVNCEGEILYDFSCTGVFSCCDTQISLNTCSDEGGEICGSDELCIGGTSIDVSDISYGETCCVEGTCEKQTTPTSTCSENNGICKSSCGTTEQENSNYNCDYGENCCIAKQKSNYLWIWILLILILISALGIVFRDRLRIQWLKLKTLFGGKKDKKRFEMPLTQHPISQGGSLPRRIFSPQESRAPVHRPFSPQPSPNKKPVEKSKNELDDVLKKLKDMGK
jgi:hypothetical protein